MKIKIGDKEFSPAEIEVLAKAGALNIGQRNNPLNTDWNMQASHGTWSDGVTPGLFTRPGGDPRITNAIRYPDAAALSEAYAGVTEIKDAEFTALTGVGPTSGENPETGEWCASPMRAGFVKACTQRAVFGQISAATNSVKLAEIGGRLNRADLDVTLVNGLESYPIVPQLISSLASDSSAINRALGLEMFSLAQGLILSIARAFYHGNKVNTGTSALPFFMKEFDGLDQVIKTGHVDLDSGEACDALDSVVVDFGSADVSSGTTDIVDVISMTVHQLDTVAQQTGVGQVWDGEIHMEPDLFFALTRIWPCSYLTDGCSFVEAGDSRLDVSANDQVAMRDAMRTGRYLWVYGRQIPVRLTRAIARVSSGNGFRSPIYFYLRDALGQPVNYLEGFDMNRADVQAWQAITPAGYFQTFNDGLWLGSFNALNGCAEYVVQGQMRLVAQMPQLLGRIENVGYTLSRYTNSPYPGEPYYVNGGRYTSRPPYYANGS